MARRAAVGGGGVLWCKGPQPDLQMKTLSESEVLPKVSAATYEVWNRSASMSLSSVFTLEKPSTPLLHDYKQVERKLQAFRFQPVGTKCKSRQRGKSPFNVFHWIEPLSGPTHVSTPTEM